MDLATQLSQLATHFKTVLTEKAHLYNFAYRRELLECVRLLDHCAEDLDSLHRDTSIGSDVVTTLEKLTMLKLVSPAVAKVFDASSTRLGYNADLTVVDDIVSTTSNLANTLTHDIDSRIAELQAVVNHQPFTPDDTTMANQLQVIASCDNLDELNAMNKTLDKLTKHSYETKQELEQKLATPNDRLTKLREDANDLRRQLARVNIQIDHIEKGVGDTAAKLEKANKDIVMQQGLLAAVNTRKEQLANK